MSAHEPYQTYETGQPWVVYTYPIPDSDIPPEGGESKVEMVCAICGVRETAVLHVPPEGTPDPPPGYKHPERIRFLAAHVHPLQNKAAETWALPLLNIAAHTDTMDILADVAERARRAQP